jgi:hypothetical protein
MSLPHTHANPHHQLCNHLHSHQLNIYRIVSPPTLKLTLNNNAVTICIPTRPMFTVLSVPHTHTTISYTVVTISTSTSSMFTLLSVPNTQTNPHKHRCSNLHPYQLTYIRTVSCTHSNETTPTPLYRSTLLQAHCLPTVIFTHSH